MNYTARYAVILTISSPNAVINETPFRSLSERFDHFSPGILTCFIPVLIEFAMQTKLEPFIPEALAGLPACR